MAPRGAPASRCCHAARTGASGASWRTEADVAAGRWVEAELDLPTGPVTVVSVYVHTGEAQTPRQEDKYRFLDAMTMRMKELADGGRPVLVAGDLNIAHTRADLRNWKGNLGKAGFLPEEQAYLDRWLDGEWVDVSRRAAGEVDGPYTWWSWRGKAFDNDTGWRIDYQLASAALAPPAVRDVGRPGRDVRRALERPRGGRRRLRPGLTAGRAGRGGSRHTGPMTDTKPVDCWLTDMDGVLVHEERAIPGASDFIRRLIETERRFLVLTNNSIFTPRDLRARLLTSGIDIPESSIWTSALATAQFLDDQRAGGSAYVIGEAGLTTALHDVGYVLTDRAPDYVVLGETRTYSFEGITRAIRLVGRRLPVHRDEPRPHRAVRRGPAAGDGLGRRAHHPRHRRRAVLHRQAQPADDAQRAQPHGRPLRDAR